MGTVTTSGNTGALSPAARLVDAVTAEPLTLDGHTAGTSPIHESPAYVHACNCAGDSLDTEDDDVVGCPAPSVRMTPPADVGVPVLSRDLSTMNAGAWTPAATAPVRGATQMDDPSDDTKIGSIDVRFALGDELAMFDWHARRGARMFTGLPAASTPRLTVTHRAGSAWLAADEFDPPYSTLMNTGCVA